MAGFWARKRDKATPAATMTKTERAALVKRAAYRRKRRLIRAGQTVMVAGGLIAAVHVVAHAGAFGGQPSGLVDLIAGYPAAALVFFAGAVMAGQ